MLSKIIKFFSKPIIIKEMVRGIVYYRFPIQGKHIKKKDYILGWGVDTNLCNRIHEARIKYNETVTNYENKLPLRSDFKEHYDNRIGYYITGEPINTRIHPLHSKMLLNTKTGVRRIIDTVTISNWYGKFVALMVRDEGSKSHGQILWENISCHEPKTIKDIKANQKLYKLIDLI